MIQSHYNSHWLPLDLGYVRPSEEELVNMAHQAVANGARGLVFQDVHDARSDVMRSPGAWPALQRVIKDLASRAFIYVLPDAGIPVTLTPPDAPVDLLLKEDDDAWYLLAVNYERKHYDIRIDLSQLPFTGVTALPNYLKPDLYVSPPREQESANGIIPLQTYGASYAKKDDGARTRLRKFSVDGRMLFVALEPIDVWWFRIDKPEPADRR